MHIGLNAHLLSFAATYRGAGISRYIRNLITHMLLAGRDHQFTVFLGDGNVPVDWRASASLRPVVSRLPTVKPAVRIAWEQLIQPFEVRRRGVDVLHSMGYVKPLASRCPSVVTVYDLSFLKYPETFNRPNRFYLSLLTRYSARNANRIIAISLSTKKDLIDLLGVPADRIEVVCPGVEDCFRPIGDAAVLDDFRRRRQVPDRFILFFGTLEPRKGADKLVEAYATLKKETGLPHRLVLGGAKGWLYESIFARVRALGLEREVIFTGYVPQEEQPLWYNCADLFVYPSMYEGFGFPPLEAMACGTPVITSNVSSLPEVVGDAAVLVEPGKATPLFEAMVRVLLDERCRERMAERGLIRARAFSWPEAARITLDLYQAVGNG
ncbi:MAG: glycosyltransferase family 4 protein [Chloroflexota bacterium]